jgi:hypothetical protein
MLIEVTSNVAADSASAQKKPYISPVLVKHGKLEKLTLQTGGGIPGESFMGATLF